MTHSLEDKTDEELVQLTLEDANVFGVLMMRYEDKLLRYIMRKTLVAREVAEDLLQESFLKAYQNIQSFDTSLAFSSWMYRIVHNVTVSHWRKEKIRPEGNVARVDDDFLDKIVDQHDLVENLDREYMHKHIGEILADMDEKYRTVLVLKFLEEKSYQEISDIIKKPMGTVATLINRAKKQFRTLSTTENVMNNS